MTSPMELIDYLAPAVSDEEFVEFVRFAGFAEEVADAVADDDLEKDGEFDLKRLLVLSETDVFDVHGAADVLAYDGCMIDEADRWRGRNVWYLGRSVRYAPKGVTTT